MNGAYCRAVSRFHEKVESDAGKILSDESANETAQEVDNELSEKMQQVNDGAAKMSDEDAIRYYMEKHPDLKGCIATNETVTQLAIKTMDQLDAKKHITLVGFDAGKEQVNALKDGKVDGLIVQNPFGMGYATVVAAARDRICPYSS